jgi:hypothetical protein
MKPPPCSRLVFSGLWRRVKCAGLERFEPLRETSGRGIRGTIIALESPGEPFCSRLPLAKHRTRTYKRGQQEAFSLGGEERETYAKKELC